MGNPPYLGVSELEEKICINNWEYINLPTNNPQCPKTPVIFGYYRDPKTLRRKEIKKVGFEPYFYVGESIKVPFYYYKKKENKKENLVKRIETVQQKGCNPPLRKVVTFIPSQVRVLRKLLETVGYADHIYEADIEFVYRFLIDKKIKCSLLKTPSGFIPIDEDVPSNIKVVFLDVEILAKTKPDPKKLKQRERIICCTIWDNYSKEYHVFYEYSHPLQLPDYGENVKIHYFLNEKALLTEIRRYLAELDPDIIAGFNIDFDLLALIKTMEQRHKINPDFISPLRRIKITSSKKKLGEIMVSAPRVRILGRSVLDLLEMYIQIKKIGLEEMSLEYIAEKEQLPVQKVQVPDFYDTWNTNPELIIRRNLTDVQIYVELDKKLSLIKFADELRKITGCRFEDTLSPKKMLDLFMLRMKGERIMPTARSRGTKYLGAHVQEPIAGLYGWTIQEDFSALYPTIIMAFNIDPDTFRKPELAGTKKENLYILDNEHAFLKTPEGLIPKMLKKLSALRKEKKKLQEEALKANDEKSFEVYKLQEDAIKVLNNALYGVMGYRFRKGSKETVESVTLMGRRLIQFVIDLISSTGRKVIYGDTDSIFFEALGKDLESCLKEAKETQELIHSKLPEFLSQFGKEEQPFTIEPAQIYSSFFILEKKKRYAGYIEWDSKRGTNLSYRYNIKGLETKRSDLSFFGKRIQKEVIHQILQKKPKEEILKFLETELNKFDTLPLVEIGIPSAIGQPLQSYKGNSIQKTSAEYSNKYLGTSFDVGSKPKRIYVKSVPEGYPETHSISIDANTKLPSGFEIDYVKMLEVTVKNKIEKLLEIINISWEDIKLKENLRIHGKIKKGKKDPLQKTLFEF